MEQKALASDSVAPETATVPRTPFDRIGGHAALRRLTDTFYGLMDSDPAYRELRAMHAPDLAPMRESLALFLAGWSGGPRDWFDRNPGKCMMSMHAPFPITTQTAAQWSHAMRRAIAAADIADREVADAFAETLTRMALGMARG